jgi:hypothetical protein
LLVERKKALFIVKQKSKSDYRWIADLSGAFLSGDCRSRSSDVNVGFGILIAMAEVAPGFPLSKFTLLSESILRGNGEDIFSMGRFPSSVRVNSHPMQELRFPRYAISCAAKFT